MGLEHVSIFLSLWMLTLNISITYMYEKSPSYHSKFNWILFTGLFQKDFSDVRLVSSDEKKSFMKQFWKLNADRLTVQTLLFGQALFIICDLTSTFVTCASTFLWLHGSDQRGQSVSCHAVDCGSCPLTLLNNHRCFVCCSCNVYKPITSPKERHTRNHIWDTMHSCFSGSP